MVCLGIASCMVIIPILVNGLADRYQRLRLGDFEIYCSSQQKLDAQENSKWNELCCLCGG